MEENKTMQEEAMQAEQAAAGQQEEEMEQAQKSGVVDMAAKKKEKERSMNYTHTFTKPVELNGKRYEKMTFYFENLTGADIEAIEEELQDQNKYVLAPEVSSVFQSMLAARAGGVPSDDMRRLPIRDYMQIKNKARAFLTSMG